MQVTNDLMEEHQLILKYIELMEQYITISRENRAEDIFLKNASIFIGFIRNFADTFHHEKEEDILFRYMDEPGVLTHCNPLPQMLLEHDQGRKYVKEMSDAVNNSDMDSLIGNAWSYAQLLKEHIFKEDNILYPMAEAGIPESQKNSLLEEYRAAEERLNSQAIWTEYKQKYSELEGQLNERKLVCGAVS